MSVSARIQLEKWSKAQPNDRDPYVPDLTGFDVEFISMKAGDLLIFNSLLPHGIRPN
ncbi:phytanoyl-CoA dioxygenase family protein [Vibrio natriegens]|uniref:phytanoyl-CoA dioxygenase family protein n=1 Tax=Vibrio natriegens TaxID=691 RepID=UPI0020CBBDE4|nr:phytanoyl-CoA dioxygenase family protein [Vibrio natriegens]